MLLLFGNGRCCPQVLLLLITYVFSVAFMTFSRGTPLEKGAFQSMGSAVMALIMKGILPDQARSGGCLVSKEYSSFSGLESLRFHLRNCLVSSCMIRTVPGTTLREFKCRAFQDAFFQEVAEQGGWLMGLLVLLFILFGSLTVMNMWLGLREGKNFSYNRNRGRTRQKQIV